MKTGKSKTTVSGGIVAFTDIYGDKITFDTQGRAGIYIKVNMQGNNEFVDLMLNPEQLVVLGEVVAAAIERHGLND